MHDEADAVWPNHAHGGGVVEVVGAVGDLAVADLRGEEDAVAPDDGGGGSQAAEGAFHGTFSVALHLVGRPVSVETPSAVGPRHWGQLSAGSRQLKLGGSLWVSGGPGRRAQQRRGLD